MQPGLFIVILVLQSERLMRVLVDPLVLFQTTPCGLFAVPQQIAVDDSHLSRDADLVAVEVVDFLFAFAFSIGVVADLRQRFVAVGIGVDIGISAVRLDFLQEVAAVPYEVGAFRFGTRPGEFVLAFFREASSERVVGVVDAVV